ncbi:MAG: hypothetical protein CXT75_08875 [Methanobacteriota archaeon]|nr:MAG: hypothetical protein CXT75_08875 [Euryarchaeota archaeon]
MKERAQLLLVSGLLMSITIIAVTSSITHSVNMGHHQGERHDLTSIMSSIENSFPLALEYEVDNAAEDVTLTTSFDNISDTFESLLISRGYSSAFTLTSSSEDSGTYTFVYSFVLSDSVMSVEVNQSITF